MNWRPGCSRNFIRVPQYVLPNEMFYGQGLDEQLQRSMGFDLRLKSQWTTKSPPVNPAWGPGKWLIIEAFGRESVNQPSWGLIHLEMLRNNSPYECFQLVVLFLILWKVEKSFFKFKCLECSVFELLLTLQ